jgi:hypothetical protein
MQPTQFVAQTVFLLAEPQLALFHVHLGNHFFEVPVPFGGLVKNCLAGRFLFVVAVVRRKPEKAVSAIATVVGT